MKRTSARGIIWNALVDAYYDAAELTMMNLLWIVFSLLVISAPAATAGLYYATNQLAHRHAISWRTFLDGFRQHLWLGCRWGLVNLFALTLLGVNVWFYGQLEMWWTDLAQGLFIGIMVLWILLQVYTFPLLLEQEDHRMAIALRNSLVLFLKYPGFSLFLCLILLLVAALSTWLRLPWLVFAGSLSTYLANRGTIYLLDNLSNQS